MKSIINSTRRLLVAATCLTCCLFLQQTSLRAQETTPAAETTPTPESTGAAEGELAPAARPVKNTFQSVWIIDNQTVMVPVKKTLEVDIMHRFGTINSFDDLWGLFAPSNIRFGVNYAPINNLFLGMGLTKNHMLWDGNAKYALLKQIPGKFPLSI